VVVRSNFRFAKTEAVRIVARSKRQRVDESELKALNAQTFAIPDLFLFLYTFNPALSTSFVSQGLTTESTQEARDLTTYLSTYSPVSVA
jgi:hypothetical protein